MLLCDSPSWDLKDGVQRKENVSIFDGGLCVSTSSQPILENPRVHCLGLYMFFFLSCIIRMCCVGFVEVLRNKRRWLHVWKLFVCPEAVLERTRFYRPFEISWVPLICEVSCFAPLRSNESVQVCSTKRRLLVFDSASPLCICYFPSW